MYKNNIILTDIAKWPNLDTEAQKWITDQQKMEFLCLKKNDH
jgi:hypothetical protein